MLEAIVEVTDTVALPYTTGLQRVARELMARLGPDDGPISYRPAVWSPAAEWYRDLTDGEAEALAHPQERLPASTAIARRFPAPVATAVRRVLAIPAMRDLRVRARHAAHRRAEWPLVDLVRPPADVSTVLLDLEAAWNDPIPRDELLPELHRAGAGSAALVADVLPVLRPEWFDGVLVRDFDRFITGHLRHSDLFLCISECTRRDLLEVAAAKGIDRELDARVVPLGSDIVQRAGTSDDGPSEIGGPIGRYLLMVGTIEPRKNQELALDAFDVLSERHPDLGLVLVGKRGWKVDELIERIERHPGFGTRVRWLEEVDDVRLGRLYRDAFLSLTPARYEGLGMTVTEAMQFGTPVVASTAGALPEAGGDAAEYAEPDDVGAWVEVIARHLDDAAHHDRAVARARAHRPHSWDASAAAVRDAVADAFRARAGAAVRG
ncbi:glycosyltransferase family 4 protein [Dermatobacter hominis]|uniref:glycosyltransferase family 4 protein n=1 Tax=Dermatobacter hominis TaxID=2884263 RepID=UPI001D120A7A|nr:glycosyltransferase family 1 protein [Dermatobacter hominis]UDY34741.1 glycosyltransferase family 4 protein [Dermatobacter hominis]